MTVQEATEAANITSYQMRDSFGDHQSFPGRLTVNSATPPWVRDELASDGLHARVRGAQLRPHQRDLRRPRARHALGRLEQLTARITASAGEHFVGAARSWRVARVSPVNGARA